MKGFKVITVLAIAFLICTACNDSQKDSAQKENKPKAEAQSQKDEKQIKLQTAHYLSEEVERIEEVEHATVLVENKDAYIAVELNEQAGTFLSEELRSQMIQSIRSADPEINNIYISNNTDFNSRVEGLGRDIERGLPAKEIGESFEQTIRSVFPELKR